MEDRHLNYAVWFITELVSDETVCKVCHLLRQEHQDLECYRCPLGDDERLGIEGETHGLLN